ncbi:Cytoplasmic dynein 2 light intermediate chain 1 [Allomyces javanicus]|nr:Cytoplasmic dynein 2 light intermediate chain 1 [Allomyces javanicus]
MSLATAAAPAPVVTKDLWAVLKDEYKALQKASEASLDAQSGHETIVVLAGGKSCGKTALINRFLDKGSDPSPPPTVGLEYTYGRRTRAAANIKDVVHLWEVGGGPAGTKVVTVPLSAATVHTTAVLLCVDLTRPADLASTIESYLAVLSSRIDELLAGLEKRGSKRPKGMRAFAMKKYTTAAAAAATSASASSLDLPSKTSHPDKARLALLPILWALVGTRYDEFRDLPSEVRKHVARLMRYYAHIYGGALVMASDRDEPALAKTKQLLSHYAFKTAAPKGECTDYNRPLYVPAGSDALSAIFAGINAASLEELKATLEAHAAAMPARPGAAAAKTAGAAKARAWDAQFAEPLIDIESPSPPTPTQSTVTAKITKVKDMRPTPMPRNAKRKVRKDADKVDPTTVSTSSSSPSAAVASADDAGPARTIARVIVKDGEFVALAQQIADATVAVPVSVLKCASCAIGDPRVCAEWFQGMERTDASLAAHVEENAQHEHFITVLERVFTILAPLCARPAGSRESGAMGTGRAMPDLDLFTNRFAALSVLDDGEDGKAAAAGSDIAPSGEDAGDTDTLAMVASSEKQHEVEHDHVDRLFVAEGLYSEIHAMRERVRESWDDVLDNENDLITASLVTSTALNIIRAHPAVKRHLFLDVLMEELQKLVVSAFFGRGLIGMLKALDDVDPIDDCEKNGNWDSSLFFAATAASPLMYAAYLYLYEMCQCYGRDHGIDVVWHDLDHFMELYDQESLFLGRVPDTAEQFVKVFNVARGFSATGCLPAGLLGRQQRSRKMAMQTSRHGERHLKARSYSAILFRDRHLRRLDTATPLERRNVRLGSSVLLNFVESVVIEEDDLLRFDLLQMHLNALDLMETIALYHRKELVAHFGQLVLEYLDADLSLVAGYIAADWYFGGHPLREGREPVKRFKPQWIVRDAAETMREWTRCYGALCVGMWVVAQASGVA